MRLGESEPQTQTSIRSGEGDWPNTTRLLPWSIALFIVAMCLVPLDGSQLRINAPIDLKLDRVILGPIFLIWVGAMLTGRERAPSLPKLGGVGVAVWAWLFIAVLSVVASFPYLSLDGELTLVAKKLVLVATYTAFFLLVASVVRRDEVKAFVTLWILASIIAAVDALITYRTGTPHLRTWFATAGAGLVDVLPPPQGPTGKPYIVGPALHGLALAAMMVMVLPFALQRLFDARTTYARLTYGTAVVLFGVAAVTTGKRTSVILPAILLLVLFAYRPRQMMRLVPLLAIFVAASQFVAPGALMGVRSRLAGDEAARGSTAGRTADYDALVPDVISHPWLGRGFGSFDPYKHRLLDNQLLTTLVETGVFGLVAFLGIFALTWTTAHRQARAGNNFSAAIIAAVSAFLVSTVLYDAVAFIQAVYLLFFILALHAVMNDQQQRIPETQNTAWKQWLAGRRFVVAAAITGAAIGGARASGVGTGMPRAFAGASAIVTVEPRPESLGQSRLPVRRLEHRAWIIEQMVGSGAVMDRVSAMSGIPRNELRSKALPPKLEQTSEARTGTGDQRSVLLLNTRAPVYITATMIRSTSSFQLTVRAPNRAVADRLPFLVTRALQDELVKVGDGRVPVVEPVVGLTNKFALARIQPVVAGVVTGLLFAAFASFLPVLLRSPRQRQNNEGPLT